MTNKEITTLPFVSTLLVTYNESEYIEYARIPSYQDYPKSLYEIIIIDGNSTDNTISLAKHLIQKCINSGELVPQVSFLKNPKKY